MNDDVQVIVPREVPLGGPRSMTVRRTLPARERSFVGAWCFVDHYGPDDVSATGGMDVAPHPHCGLATVSWLFSGEVEHRDSLGTVALVRPGEVNLMTAGRGISHSEVSTPGTTRAARRAAVGRAAVGGRPGSSRASSTTCRRCSRSARGCRRRSSWGRCGGRRRRCAVETPLVGAEVVLARGCVGGAAPSRRVRGGGARRPGRGDVRWGRGRAGGAGRRRCGAASGRGRAGGRRRRGRGCSCSAGSRSARRS